MSGVRAEYDTVLVWRGTLHLRHKGRELWFVWKHWRNWLFIVTITVKYWRLRSSIFRKIEDRKRDFTKETLLGRKYDTSVSSLGKLSEYVSLWFRGPLSLVVKRSVHLLYGNFSYRIGIHSVQRSNYVGVFCMLTLTYFPEFTLYKSPRKELWKLGVVGTLYLFITTRFGN